MPPEPSDGNPSFDSLEPARHAMGDTCRFSERINLTTMQPLADLSATGFALAAPGNEYLILQPIETGDPFTVTLAPGRYAVEWHSLGSREIVPAQAPTVPDDGTRSASARPRGHRSWCCVSASHLKLRAVPGWWRLRHRISTLAEFDARLDSLQRAADSSRSARRIRFRWDSSSTLPRTSWAPPWRTLKHCWTRRTTRREWSR